MQKMVKTGKNTETTNNSMSIFGLIEENMELSHIHLIVKYIFRNPRYGHRRCNGLDSLVLALTVARILCN
jgi:hypothetical protein